MKAQIALMIHTVRAEGLRSAVRKFGWKFVGLIFAYYLIRDTILYIILPLMAVQLLG